MSWDYGGVCTLLRGPSVENIDFISNHVIISIVRKEMDYGQKDRGYS